VQQHNSGAMEGIILAYSAVYLRIQKWKNYWNRSTFAKVTVKIKVAQFFDSQCTLSRIGYCRVKHFAWCVLCGLSVVCETVTHEHMRI